MKLEEQEKIGKQITFIADLVIAVTILFFWTSTLDAFNFPKQFVVATGFISLLIVAILRDRFLINPTRVNKIEITFLTLIALVVLLSVPNGLTSMTNFWGTFSRANGTLTKITLFLVVLIYARYSSKESISRFFNLALTLLSLEVVYGFIQLSGLDPIPWVNPYNNIFVTAGNPNFAAALLAVLVVLSTRFIFLGSNSKIRGFVFVLVILGSYTSYATKSIQGVLTIAVGIFLVVFLWSLKRLDRKRDKFLSISGLSALGAPIALGVFNLGPLASILYQETLSIRLHYWRIAIKIIRDHPIFGVGNDRYGDFYRMYREDWFVEKYGPGLVSTNAHNVALQWGADIGILGILIYVLLLALSIFTYIRKWQSQPDSKSLSNFDFLFVGFMAFYVQSLISISQLSVTCLGFALLGLLLSYNNGESVDNHRKKKSPRLNSPSSFVGVGTWWVIFCLVLAPLTSTLVRKDAELRKALQLPGASQEGADLEFRSKEITSAAQFFREDEDYAASVIQNLFGQGIAQYGLTFAKEVESAKPNSFQSFSAQVLAYSNSGQYVELKVAAEKALKLDPLNYSVRFQYGKSLDKLGKLADAKRELNEVLQQAPKTSNDYIAAQSLLAEMNQRIEP